MKIEQVTRSSTRTNGCVSDGRFQDGSVVCDQDEKREASPGIMWKLFERGLKVVGEVEECTQELVDRMSSREETRFLLVHSTKHIVVDERSWCGRKRGHHAIRESLADVVMRLGTGMVRCHASISDGGTRGTTRTASCERGSRHLQPIVIPTRCRSCDMIWRVTQTTAM